MSNNWYHGMISDPTHVKINANAKQVFNVFFLAGVGVVIDLEETLGNPHTAETNLLVGLGLIRKPRKGKGFYMDPSAAGTLIELRNDLLLEEPLLTPKYPEFSDTYDNFGKLVCRFFYDFPGSSRADANKHPAIIAAHKLTGNVRVASTVYTRVEQLERDGHLKVDGPKKSANVRIYPTQ